MRIMLTVAYDGTNYHGFALQQGACTIEGTLNDALSKLTGETITVIGASRTDAGVHAYGNVAVFDTTATIPAERFSAALNTMLPKSIRITHSTECEAAFHPRRVSSRKTYEYHILNTKIPDPMRRLYTCHYRAKLDVPAMDAAAAFLRGTHDFTSFCNVKSMSLTRERTIFDAGVKRCGDLVVIRVTGNGFLYHMVRIIAGTLIDVGRHRIPPDSVGEILEKRDRCAAGFTAPPMGLFLIGYTFDGSADNVELHTDLW